MYIQASHHIWGSMATWLHKHRAMDSTSPASPTSWLTLILWHLDIWFLQLVLSALRCQVCTIDPGLGYKLRIDPTPEAFEITTRFVIRIRFICSLHMCDAHCKKQMILLCAIPQTRLLLGGIKLFRFEISKMYLKSFQPLYQSNWSRIYQLKIIAMVPNTTVDLELHLELHLSAPTRAASHRYHHHWLYRTNIFHRGNW